MIFSDTIKQSIKNIIGSLLIVSNALSLAEAATVVRTDRPHYRQEETSSPPDHPSSEKLPKRPEIPPTSAQERPSIPETSSSHEKPSASSQASEQVELPAAQEVHEDAIGTPPAASNNKDIPHSIVNEYPITSEHYFDAFQREQPTITTHFGEGGDLAGLSSSHMVTSQFALRHPESGEFVECTVQKYRLAWAFGADTLLFFSVSYHLNTPLIVNKNKQPLFELNINGKKTIVKLKKISDYSYDYFNVTTGNVHFLDDLYIPGADVTLLIPLRGGSSPDMARIPLPQEVIAQWRQVSDADLKKMRREYDRQ